MSNTLQDNASEFYSGASVGPKQFKSFLQQLPPIQLNLNDLEAREELQRKQQLKYLVIGDWVRSKSDGQRHYIDSNLLMTLYGVKRSECVEVSADAWVEYQLQPLSYRWRRIPLPKPLIEKLIKLEPREDDDYRLPKPLIDPTLDGMASWVNTLFSAEAHNGIALIFCDWLEEQCNANLSQAAANIRAASDKELPAARQEINVAEFEWRWRDGLKPSRKRDDDADALTYAVDLACALVASRRKPLTKP